jgi:hypothetical protein
MSRRPTGPPIVPRARAKTVSETDGVHGMNRLATQRTKTKCRAKNNEKTIPAKESNNNRSDLVENQETNHNTENNPKSNLFIENHIRFLQPQRSPRSLPH